MKKIIFKPLRHNYLRLALIWPAAGIVLLLQSCCFMGPLGIASTRPCNCQPKQSTYAANNNTVGAMDGGQSTVVSDESSMLATSKNKQSVLPQKEMGTPLAGAILPVSAVFANEEINNLPLIPIPYNDIKGPETTQTGSMSSLVTKRHKSRADNKTPLGIRAIQSYITAGPNLSFKSSKENYGGISHKNKPGAGFQFGFGSSYYFTDRFAVTPSLLFKHNTATEVISYYTTGEPGGGAGQETETKYNYSYLSVPVLATFKINKQFTVMAGPEVNLLVGAKTKTKYAGSTEKTDIKSSSVKTGLGVQAGVKYEIPGSPIGIQLIYDHRISRLNKKSADYYTGGGGYDTPAWNMKSFQLGVTCAICELLKSMRR